MICHLKVLHDQVVGVMIKELIVVVAEVVTDCREDWICVILRMHAHYRQLLELHNDSQKNLWISLTVVNFLIFVEIGVLMLLLRILLVLNQLHLLESE